jgi:hypothetical protein
VRKSSPFNASTSKAHGSTFLITTFSGLGSDKDQILEGFFLIAWSEAIRRLVELGLKAKPK